MEVRTEELVGIAGVVVAVGVGIATGLTTELPEYMVQAQPLGEVLAKVYDISCRIGLGAAMAACTLFPLGLGLAYLNGVSQEGSE